MSCPYHQEKNVRDLEDSIHTDFKNDMSYGDYLCLDQILSAQKPLSDQHDEMLFITIHQASELWLKLAGFELSAAIKNVQDGDFGHAFKVISRVKQIFIQLTQSWGVLSTLTPVDYLKFRDALGRSSGFQSYEYRKLEFLLGNKNKAMLKVHEATPEVHAELAKVSSAPSIYDEAIKALAGAGFAIDDEQLTRDFNLPYSKNESVLNAWLAVYANSEKHFELYELAEKLMDIEDAFQNWRFKHMYTVQRIIGNKMGTGGSSGVGFLKKALDISFFPELLELRTRL
ncbi:tryptophan 2,3-dioxygenase [Thalassotalea sp. HSM 43]|uniref:tryptophan 2,3-dioxygenase n=1 Tax=Thalassotalea sp. HSM 43 TaxID=2552945 RepID=UPI0010813C6C|nr:tryptophan 2,3-dioxygenase family protein [Thalassotalea sp. HSM 43]QBY04904.1 tryptophan 2,3-dioxygenase [Thalassotalea sp. HSM 43]